MQETESAAAVLLCVAAVSVSAGDLQPLPTSPPLAVFGVQNELVDPLKITNGAIIGSESGNNLYRWPDGTPPQFVDNNHAVYDFGMEVVDIRTSDIIIDGSRIGLAPGPVRVGVIEDYVLRDADDGALVLAARAVLDATVNGAANTFEINNMFRRGFTGFSAAAAWSRASDFDLRLYKAARTSVRFGQGFETFDPDVVKFQSDVNVSEGNPRSGFFFLKTDAPCYDTGADAITVFQGGEEGQPVVEASVQGFIPTAECTPNGDEDAAQVPLPLWAVLATALGLAAGGLGVRRRPGPQNAGE